MNFWKHIIGGDSGRKPPSCRHASQPSPFQQSAAKAVPPDRASAGPAINLPLGLVCQACRKAYHVGADAFVTTVEFVRKSHTIVMLGVGHGVREDLVEPIGELPPARVAALLREASDYARMIQVGLATGQERIWRCGCCHRLNSYPPVQASAAEKANRAYPFPSEGYFRELSKALVAKHGRLIRMTSISSRDSVRWRLTYQDGETLVAGHPGVFEKHRCDVNFFPGKLTWEEVFEGRYYATAFFKQAGVDVAAHDIIDNPSDGSLDFQDGTTGLSAGQRGADFEEPRIGQKRHQVTHEGGG